MKESTAILYIRNMSESINLNMYVIHNTNNKKENLTKDGQESIEEDRKSFLKMY